MIMPLVPPDDLDLFGARGFDRGPPSLFDEAAHLDVPAGHVFRIDPRGDERALVPLQDGDREVLRPAPSEVQIQDAAAPADRYHFSPYQRKSSLLRYDIVQILRLFHYVIGIAPQAKHGVPRLAFDAAKKGQTPPITPTCGDKSITFCQNFGLGPS